MLVDISKTIQFSELGRQRTMPDRISPVIALATGKRVLNVGCAGSDAVTRADPVHGQIASVAAQCVGIDIFQEGVDALKQKGLDVRLADAEKFELPERGFDLAVLGDLIEHVSNPGQVFNHVFDHLRPGGQIIVTTPNPFALTLMLKSLIGRPYAVNSEHVLWFDPVLLSWIMERAGFKIDEVWWTEGSQVPLLKQIIRAKPRFHTTFGLLGHKPQQ